MSEHWDIVRKLSEAGVDLREKSVTRLTRDLSATVHKYLTDNSDSEKIDVSNQRIYQSVSINNYLGFVKEINSKDYKLIPEMQSIIDVIEGEKMKTKDAEAKAADAYAILDKKVRGYQEYLRNMEQKEEKNKGSRQTGKKKIRQVVKKHKKDRGTK